jgi:hypothetical protein
MDKYSFYPERRSLSLSSHIHAVAAFFTTANFDQSGKKEKRNKKHGENKLEKVFTHSS